MHHGNGTEHTALCTLTSETLLSRRDSGAGRGGKAGKDDREDRDGRESRDGGAGGAVRTHGVSRDGGDGGDGRVSIDVVSHRTSGVHVSRPPQLPEDPLGVHIAAANEEAATPVRLREEGGRVRSARETTTHLQGSSVAIDADAGHVVCPTGRFALARSATAEHGDEERSPGLDSRSPVRNIDERLLLLHSEPASASCRS